VREERGVDVGSAARRPRGVGVALGAAARFVVVVVFLLFLLLRKPACRKKLN
jgi:hypothetical protein